MMSMLMLLFLAADSAAVNIRALVSEDMDRAAIKAAEFGHQSIAQRIFGISDVVLILELAMILAMAVVLIALIFRARKITKEQREKVERAQRMTIKRPAAISKAEIERILGQIAAEKSKAMDLASGSYFIDHNGRLDSGAAVQEMARARGMESERLNFAISYASQAARQSGAKFKEAFALVSEESDLNVLARQLNMGKGELELILALKRSKIANSRTIGKDGGGGLK